jgi:hypothetical protein
VSFARNRADLSMTYYNRTARDVIFDLPLPPSSGYGLQARNAAKIRNAGVEASLNIRPISTRTPSSRSGSCTRRTATVCSR